MTTGPETSPDKPDKPLPRRQVRQEMSPEEAVNFLKEQFIAHGTFHRNPSGTIESLSFKVDTKDSMDHFSAALRSLALRSPWTESGRVYIETQHDLEALQKLFIISPKLLLQPRRLPATKDAHSFPYPPTVHTAKDKAPNVSLPPVSLEGEPIGEYLEADLGEEEEKDDSYEELSHIVNAFDSGTDEELTDEDRYFSARRMPTLTLFPIRYRWEAGAAISLRDGTMLGTKELEAMRTQAREGDTKAMRELISIHTGLVVKIFKVLPKEGEYQISTMRFRKDSEVW